jgi:hypothetical protein
LFQKKSLKNNKGGKLKEHKTSMNKTHLVQTTNFTKALKKAEVCLAEIHKKQGLDGYRS